MVMEFTVLREPRGTNARLGSLTLQNCSLTTPVFMPVGTHAGIRAQEFSYITGLGSKLALANTYHLLLRPGVEFFESEGDLRDFTKFPGGFLTDSGGFQIFSLAKKRRMSDEGALFQSHIDGKEIHLTPELSIRAQRAFNSDIMMVLDECIPSTASHEVAEAAVMRSVAWAKRSLAAHSNKNQALFGIVQGALYPNLRARSIELTCELPFNGFAIGGLAVGEGRADREAMTELVAKKLPQNKPRYLMGVGTPQDILEAVHRGVDMFDCVLPTMLGQQGVAFISTGKIDLRKAHFKTDRKPIEEGCSCTTCQQYDKRYLHQLIKSYDATAETLIGRHNLYVYLTFMDQIRTALAEDRFQSFYSNARLTFGDDEEGQAYRVVSRLRATGEQFSSIKHKESGEYMHSSEDPWHESQKVYIKQSKLADRLQKAPLVVWDFGLGAGTNAMGVVRCFEELKEKSAPLELISFENNLEALSLALINPSGFWYLNHRGPPAILNEQFFQSDNMSWKLLYGDAQDRYKEASLPDVIFFDPFSYKVDAPLWSLEFFKELHTHLNNKSMIAFTFTASTAVRASLLTAGFWVGYGVSTGQKLETTIFMTESAARQETYSLKKLGL